MNKRLNGVLLLMVAGLIGWYLGMQPNEIGDLSRLIKKQGEPEYIGRAVSAKVYDMHGQPQYFAKANEIKHYEQTAKTELFQPLLYLFNTNTAKEQWKITANHAEITQEKLLYLTGDIRLENIEPNSRLQRLETQTLLVDLITQDISSESEVVSTGLGFNTSGIGLSGNLKKQIATLLKDTRTYLEPILLEKQQ
ncbi:lipopolysaccharide export system protein LptC [Nicoletella semolina]|uniref:Lipopolysaccharide export system protein LptC n=1 Tax=Nicoletella semolina TaxID=271160 RepID=A0A4R2N517_9PAST|nr:LPS export ABC transporter periplasmic protein LptC [Nicoletella semolina]MDH2924105.1 LPS export ABC transporter periplasmic protein LptC [Nicoletella semolina]TCP15891.1 lipopolysaccharide export system protein LptC [Nicoletella semolina]